MSPPGSPGPGGSPLVSIVVPTYNERENLEPLAKRVEAAMTEAGLDYELLIVDDDSPDGTWKEAEALAETYPIRSIRRTEDPGLATAVLRGFREARDDVLVVMDADLQHPPDAIPDLLDAVDGGADVAVGSRFVEGGSVGDFGPLRRAISWGADALARTLFRPVRGVADLQSGFFALRREVVDDADLDPIGYKILLEVLVVGDYDEVVEVGYGFGTRHAGESNLGLGSIVDYLHHVLSLAWRSGEAARFARFAAVGAAGALVNLATLYLLHDVAGLHYLLGGALAIEGGLLSNFTLNAAWTFQDRAPGGGGLLRALGRDHLVRSGGMLLNLGVLALLAGPAGLPPLVAQALGIGVAMTWNYGGNQWWTWET